MSKRKIKVYVAGAYSSNNVLGVLQNIGRGQKLAAEVFKAGYSVFCPWHDHSYVMEYPDHKFSVDDFQENSIMWLEVSDAVLLVPNWKTSKGTLLEIEKAKELKIPVFKKLIDLESSYRLRDVNLETLSWYVCEEYKDYFSLINNEGSWSLVMDNSKSYYNVSYETVICKLCDHFEINIDEFSVY